jgi:hypothetical protein
MNIPAFCLMPQSFDDWIDVYLPIDIHKIHVFTCLPPVYTLHIIGVQQNLLSIPPPDATVERRLLTEVYCPSSSSSHLRRAHTTGRHDSPVAAIRERWRPRRWRSAAGTRCRRWGSVSGGWTPPPSAASSTPPSAPAIATSTAPVRSPPPPHPHPSGLDPIESNPHESNLGTVWRRETSNWIEKPGPWCLIYAMVTPISGRFARNAK